jgi:DNA-binding MarR family transcriptional regulator
MPSKTSPRKRTKTAALDLGPLAGAPSFKIRRTQVVVVQDFAAKTLKLGVLMWQFAILTLVQRNPGVSQLQLCAAIGLDKSSLTLVVQVLERRGLIKRVRHAHDRRRNEVTLTAKGAAVLTRLGPIARAHEARIAGALAPDEVPQLIAMLDRIFAALGR